MHKLKSLALLALAGLGLSAFGGVTTNDWWDVPFTSPTATTNVAGYGGVALTIGELGALTNNFRGASAQQPYLAGLWTMVDGDESYVTNEFNPTNTWKAFGGDNCLKLDTQGNDLTWTVDQDNVMADGLKALVDADLYLVGSDSPPDAADFDAGNDVQTAVYLKNETDEDSGETTNSVLCVYIFDPTLNGGNGGNKWQELDGVKLEDNAWAHVQVLVDHADDVNNPPTVQVFVNGTPMHARDGDATSWTAANGSASQTAGRVSSVAFRGTGAVDNFVGQTILETFSSYDFTAEVYINGQLQAAGDNGNVTRVVNAESGVGKKATFEGFVFHDQHWDDTAIDPETGEPGAYVVSYALTRIDFINLVDGTTETLTYGYDREDGVIVPVTVSPKVEFDEDTAEDEEGQEYNYYSGPFKVVGSTEGANANSTIVKIYFEDLPEEGDFLLTATQNVGTAPADQKFNVNDENLPANATFTFAEAITDGGVGYILSKIKPGTAPAGAITMDYESPSAVVTIPLATTIAEGTYNVATATYVEGTLGDQILGYEWDAENGEWTFTKKDKPVAMIGAVEYPSLRAAIAAAQAGDTIVMVADDNVSFTAENPILDIDIAVTIDGGSNTLYGVSGFAGAGYHEVRIGSLGGDGAVTIKDLAFSEFGDTTAGIPMNCFPLCTSSRYAGKLTLDGVTIDKFGRTAILLCGGSFEITNSVITGCAGATEKTKYFQSAIENYFATGVVAATTITGVGTLDPGTNGEDDEWAAAVFTINPNGNGKYTILDGEYEGQFITSFNPGSAGTVEIQGGTFIATAPKTNEVEGVQTPVSAFLDDSEGVATVEISGGWYDREPDAKYIPDGLQAQLVDPDAIAGWTVGRVWTIQFWTGDELIGGQPFFETNVFSGTTGYGPAEDPTKAETAGATFTFAGWTNETATVPVPTANLPAADGDASWLAAWTETAKTFDVTFMNEDAEFFATNVAYGATGYGPAENPTKAETAQYYFVFVGWTNATGTAYATDELPAVEENATYWASYTANVRGYEVEWIVDGVRTTNTWNYGQTPSYDENDSTVVPTKDPTDETVYEFAGWDPEVAAVTGFASYTATWTETARTYAIVFKNGEAEFFTTNAVWGATGYGPATAPEAPAGYEFKGWAEAADPTTVVILPPVGGAATYVAVFEEVQDDVHVNPGDGLDTIENAPAPIEFTAVGLCKIAFKAPAAGKYVLMTSATVNGTYQAEGTPVEYAAGALVELTETTTAATKFFKIGYEK